MPLGTVIPLTTGKALGMLLEEVDGVPQWVFTYKEKDGDGPGTIIKVTPTSYDPQRMSDSVRRGLYHLVSSSWLDSEWSGRVTPIIAETAASVAFPPEGTVKCTEEKCWLEESRGRYMLHHTREGSSLGSETCPTCKGRGYVRE